MRTAVIRGRHALHGGPARRAALPFAAALALAACGDSPAPPEPDPVTGPVRLTVTAAHPAGTLDAVPDLTWTLAGPAATPAPVYTLFVRAQAPGNAAPGVDFAGVRPASGAMHYLKPDNTWSDTEVAYAPAAGTGGTLQLTLPTLPSRPEGEWRFDLLARDATTSADLALAMAPVVLSSKPAVRVTLAQRVAAAGDALEGAVVLAKGTTARPIKMMAWWQGPDGFATQLPVGNPLAFDGTADDVRIPLLAQRLDPAAPPGTYSLHVRLFDGASGAPIAFGAQSLEVCATTAPVTGTVSGGGAALGADATFAEVTALSIDRQLKLSAPIDAAGNFSIALDPGSWAVAARVLDASGLHQVPVQLVDVGCTAAAPLALTAGAPLALLWAPPETPAPTPPVVAPIRRASPAVPSAPPEQVQILMFGAQTKFAAEVLGTSAVDIGMDVVASRLFNDTHAGVSFNTPSTLAGVATLAALQQGLGADSTATDRTLNAMTGGHLGSLLTLTKLSKTEVIATLSLVDGTGTALRRVQRTISVTNAYDGFIALADDLNTGSPTLLDLVCKQADFPQIPVVHVVTGFGSVTPSSQHTVTVHLQDAHGNTYADRVVYLERSGTPFTGDVKATTDANGDASFTVLLGLADREETLTGLYYRRSGKPYTDAATYAVQRGQTGNIQLGPTVPVVHPGGSAALQITRKDLTTGNPLPAKPVIVAADLGGKQVTASGTTDATGTVSLGLTAGTTVGLGHVTATGAAALPAPPDADKADESVVVSSPATLHVAGPTGPVLPGAQVVLSGSLDLDGMPMPGAAVTFTDAGGGTVATNALNVDDAGTFTTTFQPPPSGDGSATITVSATVEGQPISVDMPVTWTTVTNKIAFQCEPTIGNFDICAINPDGTGLTTLTTSASTDNQHPVWSPDHSKLAFSCKLTVWGICTMNADGSGLKQVISSPSQSMVEPTWSPDGLQLAVEEFSTVPGSIAIFSAADGSGLTHISTTLCNMYDPAWSPDGARFLVFGQASSACGAFGATYTYGLYTVNVDGSGLAPLGTGQWPRWSPDGSAIAYTGVNQGVSWVWTMDATGANQLPLVAGNTGSWSPDGTQLVYADWTSPGSLWIISATGVSPTKIFTGPAFAPTW